MFLMFVTSLFLDQFYGYRRLHKMDMSFVVQSSVSLSTRLYEPTTNSRHYAGDSDSCPAFHRISTSSAGDVVGAYHKDHLSLQDHRQC